MARFGVIVLAAGASTRLGQPKQLLPYRGRSLIEHATGVALGCGAEVVVVVLGANADTIRPRIAGLPITVAICEDWSLGMGRSLAVGVSTLPEGLDGVVVLLVDQPLVTADHLRALASGQGTIVTTGYAEVSGVPAYFDASHFADLLRLTGDRGARDLIRSLPHATLPFPDAALDIDTFDDLTRLRSSEPLN